MKKHYKKVVFCFVILIVLYFGSYGLSRHLHAFVHKCYHAYDIRMSEDIIPAFYNIPPIVLKPWEIKWLMFIEDVYTPLMKFELFLHSYDLLPTGCPWPRPHNIRTPQ